MKPARRLLTTAAAAALGLATWQVGSSLVKDVKFSQAQDKVAEARQDLATAADMSGVYKAVNHTMENSVVHITVAKKVPAAPGQMSPQDLFKFFGPNGQPRQPNRGQPQPDAPGNNESPDGGDNNDGGDDNDSAQPNELATGSGVIMDASNGEAFIVTNNHVVSDATEVDVVLNDGRRIEKATVVGTDPKSDVAVVKIKADRIIPAKWGDSEKLEKGDVIVAFGSPFGFVGSMSHGIVSALNRDRVDVIRSTGNGFAYENFIQVDAAINPGNSGGPLCNVHGEVVGINTAIASRTGSFAGIGFAIPSNQAKQVYEQLKSNGRVVRGYLGVGIADIHDDRPATKTALEMSGFKGDSGVLVSAVMANSPALNVLQLNDVVTKVNGKAIKSLTAFRNEIAAMTPGTTVTLSVFRDGKDQDVTIKLGTQPDNGVAMGSNRNQAPGEPAAPQQIGSLGMTIATPSAEDLEAAGLPGDSKGVIIKNVRPNSLAAQYGFQPGDLITRIGSTPIATAEEAAAAFAKAPKGKPVRFDILNKDGARMQPVMPGNPRRAR